MDDALSMIYLFCSISHSSRIKSKRMNNCILLAKEWESIVAFTHSLRRVFVSIKGIYYQAKLYAHDITWMVPHQFSYQPPKDVDMRVMSTFLEFYESQMSFVLFKLYLDQELSYPQIFLPIGNTFPCHLRFSIDPSPSTNKFSKQSDQNLKAQLSDESISEDLNSMVNGVLQSKREGQEESVGDYETTAISKEDVDVEEDLPHPLSCLFSYCKVFLSREVPIRSLDFCIKSCGGEVSWDFDGKYRAPFSEDEATHQIVDRPTQSHIHLSRRYAQPQWVYDSINTGILLPVEEYAPGKELPPHLSPFVNDYQEGYVPDQRKHLDDLVSRANEVKDTPRVLEKEKKVDELEAQREKLFQDGLRNEIQGVLFSNVADKSKDALVQVAQPTPVNPEEENNQLVSIMIPSKKKRRLYQRIQYSKQSKILQSETLLKKKLTSKKCN